MYLFLLNHYMRITCNFTELPVSLYVNQRMIEHVQDLPYLKFSSPYRKNLVFLTVIFQIPLSRDLFLRNLFCIFA